MFLVAVENKVWLEILTFVQSICLFIKLYFSYKSATVPWFDQFIVPNIVLPSMMRAVGYSFTRPDAVTSKVLLRTDFALGYRISLLS